VKYPVNVLARHQVVDLAILEITGDTSSRLQQADPSVASQMDNLLVLGHPNYRIGDSPIASPGLIVGFRPQSGIRRLLTNASIVAGCSGGPVLDKGSRVIGVAVTGADSFDEVRNTEDISVIPIDALRLIRLG
jgi:S1-C subfamily serine protease